MVVIVVINVPHSSFPTNQKVRVGKTLNLDLEFEP